jgi:hypothetical protein
MDTTFLNYMLTFSFAIILVLYLYQITDGARLNKNKKNKHIKFEPMIINNDDNDYNNRIHKKNCMPIHRVGPVYNFHQSFGKYKNMPCAGMPTGIPEMGWRNFFLTNYSNNQVVEEDPFEGIPTRNFLDNLESVDNIYRKC